MLNTYYPMHLDTLDRGRFMAAINADLDRLQADLLAYVERYEDRAVKAKAVLNLKVTIVCTNPALQQFGLVIEPTFKMPNRPPEVALACVEEDAMGKRSIVASRFDTKPDPGPRLPFVGETVDRESGEVKTAPPAEAAPAAGA